MCSREKVCCDTVQKVYSVHTKIVSVEEQRAQYNRFLRERQIAYIIFDHSQAHDAFDAAQDLSDLFKVLSHGDVIQDFETRWCEAQLDSKCNTYGKCCGRSVQVEDTTFCSVSDCIGYVRPRN